MREAADHGLDLEVAGGGFEGLGRRGHRTSGDESGESERSDHERTS
jgi:hypothetical protein